MNINTVIGDLIGHFIKLGGIKRSAFGERQVAKDITAST